MKEIRIYFADMPVGYTPDDNYLYATLAKQYKPVLDAENPDYLFYSCFGSDHLKYDRAIKIYFTGENDVPDFNICDYAIASSLLSFGDRYLRLPLYAVSEGFNSLFDKVIDTEQLAATLARKKFCNYVYSNPESSSPMRDLFFDRLSQYKPVDSGGRYRNNIGRNVDDKQAFIRDYKFTIAFENSVLPGYTTEKMTDPMLAGSMPVYWGNPCINDDFNTESFVWVKDEQSIDAAISEIARLDQDDQAYIEKMKKPWLINEQYRDWQALLLQFLSHIINQGVGARCTTPYGSMYYYGKRYRGSKKAYANPLLRPIIKKL